MAVGFSPSFRYLALPWKKFSASADSSSARAILKLSPPGTPRTSASRLSRPITTIPVGGNKPAPPPSRPFPANTRYFGDPASPQPRQWMVNFRVANLDAFLSQLRAAGIDVTLDPETYPDGRFARLHDPMATPSNSGNPPTATRKSSQRHRLPSVPPAYSVFWLLL